MKYAKTATLALVAGAVGMGLVLLAWHLWEDHQNFHALLNWANNLAAQMAKNAPAK